MEAEAFLDILCTGGADLPRTAVVVAHPDDEVVGMGSRLGCLRRGVLVHVTDGAPRDLFDARNNGCATREDYAALRRREFQSALSAAGLSPENARELGCVDQEVSLRMAELARDAAALLRETGAEFVITHPYEGGHPDHDATAFVVHAARRLMERDGAAPALVEMTSYFSRGGSITPFEFLPGTGAGEVTVLLSEAEGDFKRRLLVCYPSQEGTLRYFPVSVERFRPAPLYDFTRPPHEGKLFYECFPWGMQGDRFRCLAAEAMETLGLEGPL